MSFQESSTTFNSGSAGLTAASFFIVSFFIASWAWAGNANASRTIARNGIFFISFSTIEFSQSKFRNQRFSFLFRLRQLRNDLSNFIEYLVHALQLTAIFCALHGFIANEGEFRPAVSKILKQNHVVSTFDSLMFYSQLCGLNLVSLRVGKVHGGNDLFQGNNLMVFTAMPELLSIRRSRADEIFSSHAKIHLATRRSKTLRPPPLHHVLRVGPRLPN